MDSITHVALGAVVGEAIGGRALGKRAMFIGALAQSFPDVDFIVAFFLPAADNLLAHRGLTHSFIFGILSTVALSFLAKRFYHEHHRQHNLSLSFWFIFIGVEILLHLFLDACNAYGIGWFEPFSHQRVSFHILFVADPFFSLWTGLALIALMTMSSKHSKSRKLVIHSSLIVTAAYFFYAVYNKSKVEKEIRNIAAAEKISYKSYFTTPSPFNTWLWFAAIEGDDGFYTTYRSVNDEGRATLTYFPQQKHLIESMYSDHELQQLLKFSQDKYTIEQHADTLIFNDLRFAQIAGWDNPRAPFVFHYYLNYPEANLMVIQRGRFSNWNKKTFGSMLDRIGGN